MKKVILFFLLLMASEAVSQLPAKETYFKWDTVKLQWNPYEEKIFSYNSRDQLVQEKTHVIEEGTVTFRVEIKYEYDTKDRIVRQLARYTDDKNYYEQTFDYKGDSVTKTVGDWRTISVYSKTRKLLGVLQQDKWNDTWRDQEVSLYEYDNRDTLIKRESFVFIQETSQKKRVGSYFRHPDYRYAEETGSWNDGDFFCYNLQYQYNDSGSQLVRTTRLDSIAGIKGVDTTYIELYEYNSNGSRRRLKVYHPPWNNFGGYYYQTDYHYFPNGLASGSITSTYTNGTNSILKKSIDYFHAFERGTLETDENIMLYPNPSVHYFFIESQVIVENSTKIEIFDSMGKQVEDWQADYTTTRVVVNVNHLATGVYLVRVSMPNEAKSFRLFKK